LINLYNKVYVKKGGTGSGTTNYRI
jgi:hypothetical protein